MRWLVRFINRIWFCKRLGHIWNRPVRMSPAHGEAYGKGLADSIGAKPFPEHRGLIICKTNCVACGAKKVFVDIETEGI